MPSVAATKLALQVEKQRQLELTRLASAHAEANSYFSQDLWSWFSTPDPSYDAMAAAGYGWDCHSWDASMWQAPQIADPNSWAAAFAQAQESPSNQTNQHQMPAWSQVTEAKLGETASVSRSSTSCGQSSDAQSEDDAEERRTTAVLKRMPRGYTLDALLARLDEHGFSGDYDFVYLPHDFKSLKSFGFAHINFVSVAAAERFLVEMKGFKDWGCDGGDPAEVAFSTKHQGLTTLVEHYRNMPLMHSSVPQGMKPALFHRGMRVEFPEPDEPLKAPRLDFGALQR